MYKSILDRVRSTEISSTVLPRTSPLKLKIGSVQRYQSVTRSLNESTFSATAELRYKNIGRSGSFYNDHKKIYEHRSRVLSERSLSFQNPPLTMSQRRKYQSDRTEQVVGKRQRLRSYQSVWEVKKESKSVAIERFHNIAANKYKKLVYGQKMVKVNKELLEKGIRRNWSEKSGKKWKSPFVGQSQTQRLRGKPLISKRLDPLLPPGNPSQIKVLNLDRLFRLKQGKLTNVIPFPSAKLCEVSSRENLFKAVKNQDKIHEAIKQYNSLLKFSQLQKVKPRLGIKGKNFTKSPTIQQLMGLKMGPSKSLRSEETAILQAQVFMNHCKYFQQCVKQDIHITRRIVAGLVQGSSSGYLTLSAFTLFWQLFISRLARFQDKVNFLVYFLLPAGQERVDLQMIRLILEVMCRELPDIEKLDLRTDMLSGQQKSKIFLQALIRVLFENVVIGEGRGISRVYLKQILKSNQDACDLLIRLLQVDG